MPARGVEGLASASYGHAVATRRHVSAAVGHDPARAASSATEKPT